MIYVRQRKTPSIGRKSNLDTANSCGRFDCVSHIRTLWMCRGGGHHLFIATTPNVLRLIWLLNHSGASQTHPIIIIISRAFFPPVSINQIKLYDFNSFINSIINAAEYVTHFMASRFHNFVQCNACVSKINRFSICSSTWLLASSLVPYNLFSVSFSSSSSIA